MTILSSATLLQPTVCVLCVPWFIINKKLISRWDSERKLFDDDIVHVLRNTNNRRKNS